MRPFPHLHAVRRLPLLLALAAALLPSAETGAQVAPGPDRLHDAVRRSLPLLQASADQWFERRSCSSCHHQGLGTIAVAVAEEAGFAVDTARLLGQARRTLAPGAGWLERYATQEASINEPIGQSYRAVGIAAGGHPPTLLTDAIVQLLSSQQHMSGRWVSSSHRPPHEDSDFTATALSIRALQLYAPAARREELLARVAAARAWLERATPESTEDQAMQLLGLAWSGQRAGLQSHVSALRAAQREDGGWAQVTTRGSDAYATGQTLVALRLAGGVSLKDADMQRGVQFLIRSQLADGSWHVPTRRTANGGLPYFESGYPHGRDQFISYAGAAWATMALSLAATDASSRVLMGAVTPRFAVDDRAPAPSGLTPLMHVALSGTADALADALRERPNVNETTAAGLTALMCAAHDAVKVRLLLEAGADARATMRSGHSALLLAAASHGAGESVDRLLQAGAAVDAAATRSNHGKDLTALGRALSRGDTAVAARLLAAGAHIDGPPGAETTPLLATVFTGDAIMVDWVLRHGAAVDGTVPGAETPLMIAAIDGRTDVVRVLLRAGARVDLTDRDGFTALHFAAETTDRGDTRIVDLLLAAGADRTRTTRAGETPSLLASRWHKEYMVERLAREP